MRLLWIIGLAIPLVGCTQTDTRFDFDGDGWEDSSDCGPEDASIYPGADEDCLDDVDNDCDGLVDGYDDECQSGIQFSGELEFPDTVLGCEEILDLTLINDTDATVVVLPLVLLNDPGALVVTASSEPPWSVEPFSGLDLQISFIPSAADHHAVTIQAYTDHEDYPIVVTYAQGWGVTADSHADEFVAPPEKPVDQLWVVDSSGSMYEEQEMLASLGAALIGFFDDNWVDYHIGVVTTFDEYLNGGERFIDGNSGNPAGAYATNVTVGTGGFGDEQPLLYGTAALQPAMTNPGEYNEGFLRDEAALAVIIMTDEDDHSPADVQDYVDQLWALKDDPADVSISAIYPTANGCDGGLGAPRIAEAIAVTGGVDIAICDADWTPVYEDDPIYLTERDRFELSQLPYPGTIQVTVDQVGFVQGWTWVEADNAIVFEEAYIPQPNASVVVEYNLPGC